MIRSNSLDVYKRGFVCALSKIWSRIPIEIIDKSAANGWLKIKTACSNFFNNWEIEKTFTEKRKVSEETETYSTKLNNELDGNVEIYSIINKRQIHKKRVQHDRAYRACDEAG